MLLERALAREPDNPQFLNDLAAILLARGVRRQQPIDLSRALSAADVAIRAAASRPESCFNRALALEHLFLIGAAREAWDECLALNRHTDWEEEIQKRLAALSRPSENPWPAEQKLLNQAALQGDFRSVRRIVDRHPQLAREYAEEELLAGWAEAEAQGRRFDAERPLRIARNIGEALASRGEDMLRDSIRCIEDARRNEAQAKQTFTTLVTGHRVYACGLKEYRQGLYARASRLFQISCDALLQAGSPFASWAELQLARCSYQQSGYKETSESLQRLLGKTPQSRYPVLAGRCLWVKGLTDWIQGHPGESTDAFTASLSLFQKAGEAQNLALVHAFQSEAYEAIGDTSAAWQHQYEALRGTRSMRDPSYLFRVWEQGVVIALRRSEPRLALYFQNELLRVAQTSGDPVVLVGGLKSRAAIRVQLGEGKEALSDVRKALELLGRIPDPSAQRSLLGDLLLVAAEAEMPDNPNQAIVDLDKAFAIYQSTDFYALLSHLRVLRARGYLKEHREHEAEVELQAAIRDREQRRQTLTGDLRRAAYFDLSRSLFDEMIAFQVDRRQRADSALEYAERGRSRALLDWIAGLPNAAIDRDRSSWAGAEPLRAAEIRSAMPEDTALVEYWLLNGRLLAWVVTRREVHLKTVAISSEELSSMAARLSAAARGRNRNEFMKEAKRAYRLLVQPVEQHLKPMEYVVFVPDSQLYDIPFAALVNPANNRHLIESHGVSVSPSASIYIAALRKAASRIPESTRRLLVVGNPAFNQERFPNLPRLKQAEGEVTHLAHLYPGAEFLLGEEATKESFLREAGRYELVHFSGHSLVNTETPLLSLLLFTPTRGNDSGTLYAHELLGRRLEATRLVFLSGCNTARGYLHGTEGVSSIARPFLAAGVPAVVASLWGIDDASASQFVGAFYSYLKSDRSAIKALRDAQLDMIRRNQRPARTSFDWAAFELIGGG